MGYRKRIAEATTVGTVVAVAVTAIVGAVLQPAQAYPRPGQNVRVSEPLIDTPGPEGAGLTSSVSATGRYVAFASMNNFLVPADTNVGANVGRLGADVFVYDRDRDESELISVSTHGVQGVGASEQPSISHSGRYVAFVSDAPNLVEGDTNLAADIFVHDRKTARTERVSVASDGTEAATRSSGVSISSDGRFIAFDSGASNLVAGDTNAVSDVFVHDRKRHRTVRVSMSSQEEEGNNGSGCSSVSDNGRFVVFSSIASNLVEGDLNGANDVFVHDRSSGKTERVSVASDGTEGRGTLNSQSGACSKDGRAISSDGQLIAFTSHAQNLVPNDSRIALSGDTDVFVHDRRTGRTELLSVTSFGEEASGNSNFDSMSRNGRYITFYSAADDLFCCDTSEAAGGLLGPNDPLCTTGLCPVLPPLNGDWDVFIHDRRSGSTDVVSIGHDGAQAADCGPASFVSSDSQDSSVSNDGRFVSFRSCAANLVEGDARRYTGIRDVDIYLRDRGQDLGVGQLGGDSASGTDPNDERICIGEICIPPLGSIVFIDDSDDVGPAVSERGANLIGGRVAHQTPLDNLYAVLELEHMPRTPALAALSAGTVYGISFKLDGKPYEIRAASTGLGSNGETTARFALFSCPPDGFMCTKVADLKGGFGTTGERITFSVPMRELGTEDGSVIISEVKAFTALGSLIGGAVLLLDEASLRL